MQLTDVQFGYRSREPVVDGISASLASGRFTALIGPNAAGKSTLLRLMLGLERPWHGQVTLQGREIGTLSTLQRAARLAYVSQRPATQVAFTVEEVVAMGRFAVGPDARQVDHALEVCDLSPVRRAVMAELSAGQQQRVALARALAQIADLGESEGAGRFLLLDEPLSAMDLRHVHQTLRLLKSIAKRGLGVLAVMHDLNLASAYADDVWLLDGGRLAAAGTWEQVMSPTLLSRVYRVELAVVSRGAEGRPVLATTPVLQA